VVETAVLWVSVTTGTRGRLLAGLHSHGSLRSGDKIQLQWQQVVRAEGTKDDSQGRMPCPQLCLG